eukprot:4532082-Pyramimonas_sp.AAC.1
MLYWANWGTVTLGGKRFGGSPVRRGVRQRDPDIMRFVCLSLDPALRRARARSLAHAGDCLFA